MSSTNPSSSRLATAALVGISSFIAGCAVAKAANISPTPYSSTDQEPTQTEGSWMNNGLLKFDTNNDGIADAVVMNLWGGEGVDSIVADLDFDGIADSFGTDVNGDGLLDMVGVDSNQDGIFETFGADTDGDSILDVWGVDVDGNGTYDLLGGDMDGDGVMDAFAGDLDLNGTFETVGTDIDGDGILSAFEMNNLDVSGYSDIADMSSLAEGVDAGGAVDFITSLFG
jgi:hypothetical protein